MTASDAVTEAMVEADPTIPEVGKASKTISAVRDKENARKTIGKYLLGFAWLVEIFAVVIGLAIAGLMGYSAQQEAANARGSADASVADSLNILIAALPFLMVAIVELTKIPFVQAFYHSTTFTWKVIFGFVLLFLSFITFESAINGFERNFNALTYVIDSDKKDLVNVEETIASLQAQRVKADELNPEAIELRYNNRISEISSVRNERSTELQNRISDLRATIQSEYLKGLRDQRDDLAAQVASMRQERDQELARVRESQKDTAASAEREVLQRRSDIEAQIKDYTLEITRAQQRRDRDLEDAGVFTSKDAIRKRSKEVIDELYEKRAEARELLNQVSISTVTAVATRNFEETTSSIRERYRNRLDEMQNSRTQLNREIASSTAARERDIESSISGYMNEINDVETRYQTQAAEASSERLRELDILAGKQQEIGKIDSQLQELETKRVELRNQINIKVGDNQIYRLAQWWFGQESAADLQRDQVLAIAIIWFGSLAALVAFTGVFLALASEVIKDISRYPVDDGRKTLTLSVKNLINSLRRFLIRRRKNLKEVVIQIVTKEIVKEVPVTKIELTEVPVEYRVKEIVHVPFYTNDPDLLNLQNSPGKFDDFVDGNKKSAK